MLAHTPLHQLVDRTTLEPWRTLLLDSADRIERRGHTKHELCSSQGALCFRGALWNAKNYYTYEHPGPISDKAEDRMGKFLGFTFGSAVVSWNNAPERTAEEVITAMRACALQGIYS